MTLNDVVRDVGSWPIDLERVYEVLNRADRFLPEGRDTRGDLTEEQLDALYTGRVKGGPGSARVS